MTRHAYLILAHSQPEVLRRLVSAIDDVRNDIYIHLDRKVRERPWITTNQSRLIWLEERMDVRWGDVSVVEAELALFARASREEVYAYYHLLSGVDLPLRGQDEIHAFFDSHQGREFVGFYRSPDLPASLERKVHRWHLFARSFRQAGALGLVKRIIRRGAIALQDLLRMRRNDKIAFYKGTQWVSITHDLVQGLVSARSEMLSLYRATFCADEIFVQTYIVQSGRMSSVYDAYNEGNGCMRHIGWQDNQLHDFTRANLSELKASDKMFARKFNDQDLEFLDDIIDYTHQ